MFEDLCARKLLILLILLTQNFDFFWFCIVASWPRVTMSIFQEYDSLCVCCCDLIFLMFFFLRGFCRCRCFLFFFGGVSAVDVFDVILGSVSAVDVFDAFFWRCVCCRCV